MLRLDIAWLLGAAWLARDPSSAAPDWPPEPDRIFSALVASWGAGGEDVGERAALEWLEGLAPPRLVPADATRREAPTVFVPPNDVTASDIRILPSLRRRQPRRFPAVALDADAPCHLRLLWTEEPAPDHLAALNAVACRTSYIGHSTSLVRCRFDTTGERPPEGRPAHRAPYRGRLAELEALHHRHMKGDERARPRPSTRAGASDPAAPPTEGFTADAAHWVVFEHAGGERPDLRAAAILCDTLRVALMESWTKFHGAPAPGWIAGHEADGAPARAAHIAIAPMANVGWNHSDGRLMGLALLPPKAITARWAEPGPEPFRDQQAFLRVIASLGEADGEGSRLLTLAPHKGKGGWEWRLRPTESGAHSLEPARYLRAASHWASVTPVLLDRHLKAEGDAGRAESVEIVARACERIGLPRPISVEVGKYSAIRSASPAWPPGGAPKWQNWSRKTSFGQRRLFHVRLAFAEPVAGPVLIGAGRFVGLGLCLPVKAAP